MNAPLTQAQFMVTLRYVIFAGGMWLSGHKYISADSVNTMVSAGMIIGPLAWAYIDKWLKSHQAAAQNAAAVQAGINLVMSKSAVTKDGNAITSLDAGDTPPKPVTVQSSKEIIKVFAPDSASVAKS